MPLTAQRVFCCTAAWKWTSGGSLQRHLVPDEQRTRAESEIRSGGQRCCRTRRQRSGVRWGEIVWEEHRVLRVLETAGSCSVARSRYDEHFNRSVVPLLIAHHLTFGHLDS